MHHKEEKPQIFAARESPHTAKKTQHSQNILKKEEEEGKEKQERREGRKQDRQTGLILFLSPQ